MKSDSLTIGDTAAAEDIESTADGRIQPTATKFVYKFQIGKIPDPSGIGRRDGDPGRQFLQQINLDTSAFSLDIGRMDQEFITTLPEFHERFRTDSYIGELLPSVSDDIIIASLFPAAEVEDQAAAPHCPDQTRQTITIDLSILEDTGSYDNMGSAPLQPQTRIIRCYPPADLQAAGPGGKRLHCSLHVAGPQHYDMTTRQVIIPVQFSKP